VGIGKNRGQEKINPLSLGQDVVDIVDEVDVMINDDEYSEFDDCSDSDEGGAL